jgi:conjugative relaxase-like TrwC/TraI family protein
MVSIGKLAAGQADYYLEQAHRRVNGADGVSSGVEDYYLGGGEAPGVWIGAGAAALGLRGTVGPSELRSVLANLDPRSGVELRRWGNVPGFDVTFSAPKSVSLLFGIGDDRLRRTVRDAHDAAVAEAFGYLERAAALARRGSASRGTLEVVAGRGLVAAAFRHRTSRAGDPQLHTHVLVANLVPGPDGRWSALDVRALYAHAKTAGYLLQPQ